MYLIVVFLIYSGTQFWNSCKFFSLASQFRVPTSAPRQRTASMLKNYKSEYYAPFIGLVRGLSSAGEEEVDVQYKPTQKETKFRVLVLAVMECSMSTHTKEKVMLTIN